MVTVMHEVLYICEVITVMKFLLSVRQGSSFATKIQVCWLVMCITRIREIIIMLNGGGGGGGGICMIVYIFTDNYIYNNYSFSLTLQKRWVGQFRRGQDLLWRRQDNIIESDV